MAKQKPKGLLAEDFAVDGSNRTRQGGGAAKGGGDTATEQLATDVAVRGDLAAFYGTIHDDPKLDGWPTGPARNKAEQKHRDELVAKMCPNLPNGEGLQIIISNAIQDGTIPTAPIESGTAVVFDERCALTVEDAPDFVLEAKADLAYLHIYADGEAIEIFGPAHPIALAAHPSAGKKAVDKIKADATEAVEAEKERKGQKAKDDAAAERKTRNDLMDDFLTRYDNLEIRKEGIMAEIKADQASLRAEMKGKSIDPVVIKEAAKVLKRHREDKFSDYKNLAGKVGAILNRRGVDHYFQPDLFEDQ